MSQVGFVAVATVAVTAIVVIGWEGVIIFEDIAEVDIFQWRFCFTLWKYNIMKK